MVTDATLDGMDAASHSSINAALGIWHSASHTIMLRREGVPPLAPRYVPETNDLSTVMHVHLRVTAEGYADSNDDGIPDWWWELYGYDPHHPPGADSRDPSGMTYREKMLAGLVPGGSAKLAVFEMGIQDVPGGRDVSFVLSTVPGRRYLLQTRSTLTAGIWENVGEIFTANANETNFVAHAPAESLNNFYRLVVLPW